MAKKSKWKPINTKNLNPGCIYKINKKVHKFIENSKKTIKSKTFIMPNVPMVVPTLIEYEQFLIQYENCINDTYKNPSTWMNTDTLYWKSSIKPNLVQVICNCDFFEIKKDDTLIFLDYFNINRFYNSIIIDQQNQQNDYKDLFEVIYKDEYMNSGNRYDPLLLFYNPKTQQKYFLMSSDEIVGIEQNSGYNFLEELIQ